MAIHHVDILSICCTDKIFFHNTYGKFIYMLYEQVVYICHIDKDVSDDTEQVHNVYIDMTYLRKRYINIAPTGHNLSFT